MSPNNDNIMANLALTLFSLRKKKGLTLKDVSKKTDLTPSYLSAIENGNRSPNVEVLDKICSGIGSSLVHSLLLALLEKNEEQVRIDGNTSDARKEMLSELKNLINKIEILESKSSEDDGGDGEIDNFSIRKKRIQIQENLQLVS